MKPRAEGFLPEAEGHRVYWAEYGNPKGTPLLMVHGGFGYVFDIEKFSALDTANSRIITLHQRGVGRSQPAGETMGNTTDTNSADIERLRQHLDIDAWDVFAWSSGTVMAASYAFQHPTRCKSLTCYAPYFGSNEDYMLLFETNPDTAHKYFESHNASNGYDIVKSVHDQARAGFEDAYKAYAATQTVYDPAYDAEKGFNSKTRAEWNDLFRTRRIGAQLDEELFTTHDRFLAHEAAKAGPAAKRLPVTLVYGEKDMWEAPHAYANQVFPHHRTIMVPDAEHDVHGPAAQQVLKALLSPVHPTTDLNAGLSGLRNLRRPEASMPAKPSSDA